MSSISESVTDFAVLKTYLYFLEETTENLDIKQILSHCDKTVYSKLLQIIWKHGDETFKVIPLIGGFHQGLCMQKTIHECFACLGLNKCVTGVGITKSSSAAKKAVYGLPYNTSICVYKQNLDVIVPMQTEEFTNVYNNIDEEMPNRLINLRKVNVPKM